MEDPEPVLSKLISCAKDIGLPAIVTFRPAWEGYAVYLSSSLFCMVLVRNECVLSIILVHTARLTRHTRTAQKSELTTTDTSRIYVQAALGATV